ncbi:MAG: hypothetical protein BZY81_04380 [SAR202 cluster bacterium Io17-Chloro-G4]|nr:MAG: hypothetical protein BZY81_04380 [SAR202 cluster bacterium Io17-Chloro-G4]
MTEKLFGLFESPEHKLLATGFGFTDGPLWHPDGYWEFADIPANRVYWLPPGGAPGTLRENSGGSNGRTFDIKGRVVSCEGEARRVTRRETNGRYTTLAEHIGDKRLSRPHDLVCRSDGSIFFSDPQGHLSPQEQELGFGGIHRILPDGSVMIATMDTEYPNGLAFSPDEATLYIAITRLDDGCLEEKRRGEVCLHQFIRAFTVASDGSLSDNRIFAQMFSAEPGVPVGVKVNAEGRVFCNGPGGCWVFEPSGEYLGIIRLPEIPANCAWGEADNSTMLFTAGKSVYSLRMKSPGCPLPGAPRPS